MNKKITKNKFLIVLALLILTIFGVQFIFSSTSLSNLSTNATLIKGEGFVNNIKITLNKENKLVSGDIVETKGEDSLVVIQWGGGSITRLGGNAKIEIKSNMVKKDLSKIQIAFELFYGKTWSNVVSYFGEDSFFEQNFKDNVAGVRGTIFEVNLDKNYIYVEKHAINLTIGSKVIKISENKPFSLSSFSFIDLFDFEETLRNKIWEELNINFDKEIIKELGVSLNNSNETNNPILFILEIFFPKYRVLYAIDKNRDISEIKKLISNLDNTEKIYIYNKVLTKFQKVNFASPNNQHFAKKMYYKKILLLVASDKEKENLITNTLYDFTDAINIQTKEQLKSITTLLKNNSEILNKIDDTILQDLNLKIDLIPEELKNTILEDLNDIKQYLNIGDISLNKININNLKNKAAQGLDEIDGAIKSGLDNLFGN